MSKKVNLKDIAQALNLSITTVSRALNDKPDISSTTKRAVLEVAEMMNYQPNIMAISLRKNESRIVGVILPYVDHYFFSIVLKGIIKKAQQENYLVIIGESQHNEEKEKKLINEFISICVAGVLMLPSRNEVFGEHISILKQRNIPIVLIDRILQDYEGYIVCNNDYEGAKSVVNHFIRQGYRKIAHLRGPVSSSVAQERFRGYVDGLKENGIEFDEQFVKTCEQVTIEEGYYLAKQLFFSGIKPDAFFTINDNVALGVYRIVKELGLSVPNDIGVVGYSNSEISQHVSPSLSTVEQSGYKMGETSFEFMIHALSENATPLKKMFNASLIIRESSIRLKP